MVVQYEIPAPPAHRPIVTIGPFQVETPAGTRVSIDHVRYQQDRLEELTLTFTTTPRKD